MAQQPLTDDELQALLTSPKEFLGRRENVQKVLGTDLTTRRALKDQIARKVGVSADDLALKLSGSGVDEYYAVTAAVNFRSRAAEKRRSVAKKRTARPRKTVTKRRPR